MSSSSNDEFRESFFLECDELLETMHDGFASLGGAEDDPETIHAVFRAVHSIKGGAGAFGLDQLVEFAHRFETGLDSVRSGTVEIDPSLLMLFQRCGDHLSDQVSAARGQLTIDRTVTNGLFGELNSATGTPTDSDTGEEPDFQPLGLDFDFFAAQEDQERNPDASLRKGTLAASPELFSSGNEVFLILRELQELGSINIVCDISSVPPLADLNPMNCLMSWSMDVPASVSDADLEEVFAFVSDCISWNVAGPNKPSTFLTPVPEFPALAIGPFNSDEDQGAELGVSLMIAAREDIQQQDKNTEKTKSPSAITKKQKNASAATIRVALDRVDRLINLVGELVIKEAILTQSIADAHLPNDSEVVSGLNGLKQLASEIQEGVMAIRAQPVKPIFQRMARTVRDASMATGKPAELVTIGEGTEVDKTVLERLIDPLTHMVRNAVDHGLEHPDERVKVAKPSTGTITLSAAHRSGRVIIEISDDGSGVNRERVREIAIDKGLVQHDAELSISEIDNLLLLPGFSSKEEVSELSGRGVGLDVAKNEILALGGKLSIHSEPGKGTTFSISLPLTLAVMEGMVIKAAGQTMIIPITAVRETLQVELQSVHTLGASAKVFATRQGLVPLVDLGTHFGFRESQEINRDQVLLIVETDARQNVAVLVDQIQDQRQVVIKSLETNYRRIDGISAATILGDGRIALIVDPDSLRLPNAPDAEIPEVDNLDVETSYA
ncbi:chemotaxis protein CheA [Roseobacteraceae bacterium S113]